MTSVTTLTLSDIASLTVHLGVQRVRIARRENLESYEVM
jgi:hypothetical protein